MGTIGVLSLQGCVSYHYDHLTKLGVKSRGVRFAEDLKGLDGLILPGGESSTMLKLLGVNKLFESLQQFSHRSPCWGICAGSILLAEKVTHPKQDSLGAIGITAERNFYGSQLDSFKAELTLPSCVSEEPTPLAVDFIRAPKLSLASDDVEELISYQGNSVMLRTKLTLCTSFHSELGDDSRLYSYFMKEFCGL